MRFEENLDPAAASSDPAPAAPTSAGNGPTTTTQRPSTIELIRSIASDLSLLGRKQAELAKQELKEIAAARGMGIAMLVAAGVLALFVVSFLGLSAAAALDLVLPRWAALLIVAGVFLLLTAVAALLGRGLLRRPPSQPQRTKETLREDARWAKQQLKR